MNNIPKIYAIIVTYNGLKWVDFCLGSLRHSNIPLTPLIIDNCSTDETITYIKASYPEAIILEQTQNLGFGQANNIGFRFALEHNADYVLLLNQDAAIAPDLIELCLEQSDSTSLLSPIHMNGDGSQIDNNFRKNSLIKCEALINDVFTNQIKPSYVCGQVCAACWLLPISIIRKIGGFNPLFFHYAEDDNFYHRLMFHNISIRLIPQAKMFHDRKDFGNKLTYNKQWLTNALLLISTNINLTSKQRIAEYIKILIKCYVQKLPLNQYRIGAYIYCMCKIITKYPKINKYRNLEKQVAPTFL